MVTIMIFGAILALIIIGCGTFKEKKGLVFFGQAIMPITFFIAFVSLVISAQVPMGYTPVINEETDRESVRYYIKGDIRYERDMSRVYWIPFSECKMVECEQSQDNTEKLNDRQKQILAEVGLPTKYDELTASQKNDIAAIEDMLCYLEKTYDVKACYKNFIRGGILNDEELIAEVNGKQVSVSRKYQNKEYIYTDNYRAIMSTEAFEDAIKTYFNGIATSFKVYAEIISLGDNEENILDGTNAEVYIFLGEDMTKESLNSFAAEFGNWYTQKLNGYSGYVRFYNIPYEDLLLLTGENFFDFAGETPREKRVNCLIKSDGTITIQDFQ